MIIIMSLLITEGTQKACPISPGQKDPIRKKKDEIGPKEM